MRDRHREAIQKKREAVLEQEKLNRYNYIMQKNMNLVNPYISRPIYTHSVYHSPVSELPKPAFTRPCVNRSPEDLYEEYSINESQATAFGLELPSDDGSTVTHAPYVKKSKKKSIDKPFNNYVESELKNVVETLPKSVKEHDATDDFFLSMCVMTKDLPETFQIRIQKIVFAAVMEAREEYIQYQHDRLVMPTDQVTHTRQNSKKISSIVTVHQAPMVSPPSGYPVETVVKVIPEGTDACPTTYVPTRCCFDNNY